MENKKLIRFVESFILLPIMTISLPFGDIPKNIDVVVAPQILLTQLNTETSNRTAFNQALEEKQKLIKIAKAKAIDDYFAKRNAPLKGMGMKMVEEAEKNNLDYRLLPAIATIESNAGKQSCKKVKHSFLGWGSCKINFESPEKSIEIVAWNLGGNNPKTDQYYANKTTEEILRAYNPPSIVPDYVSKVMKVMNSIGEQELITDVQH